MAEVLFFIAAAGTLAGAIGVLWMRNPFYSVLALVGHLVSLAALFLLLRSEFVAAAQVVVYAGAVMVLYVFVVSYVGGGEAETLGGTRGPGLRIAAPLFAAALLVELCIATLGSGLKAIDSEGAPYQAGFGTPEQIGELLLTKFLLPFEVASYLLLVGAVGGVVLARRRRGLEELEELEEVPGPPRADEASRLARRPDTETMREPVTGSPAAGRSKLIPGRKGW